MNMQIRHHAAGVTDTGMRRSRNEDALLVRDDVALFTVADGMGGHTGGQWASQQVKDALETIDLTGDFDSNFRKIEDAVHAANAAISDASEEVGARMGTTVAVLHLRNSRFAVFWAGDSRIYLFRHGELRRVTTDHTSVQEMIDAGVLTPEQALTHPSKHVLSRAVGASPTLVLDAIVDQVEPQDRFLVCSDGLTGVVSEAEIAGHIKDFDPKEAVDSLLALALKRGAPDNVTIIAVTCDTQIPAGELEADGHGGTG